MVFEIDIFNRCKKLFEIKKQCSLIFFFTKDILFKERDFQTAALYINMGITYCSQNRIPPYTHIMLILTKGLVRIFVKILMNYQNIVKN